MTEKDDSFFSRLQKEFAMLVDECQLKQAKLKYGETLKPEDAIAPPA